MMECEVPFFVEAALAALCLAGAGLICALAFAIIKNEW